MITDAILVAIFIAAAGCWTWFLAELAGHGALYLYSHPYLAAGLVITGGLVVAMGWPRKL